MVEDKIMNAYGNCNVIMTEFFYEQNKIKAIKSP